MNFAPWAHLEGGGGVQPYRLAIIGEKSSLEPVLGPVAAEYGADLYLPTGEISDTILHRMASRTAAEERPLIVFYFADADPCGWQMGVSVSRKLQALSELLGGFGFEVHRVALTPDQVRGLGLPSTPLKATEKRAGKWRGACRHGADRDRRGHRAAPGRAGADRPRRDRPVLRRHPGRPLRAGPPGLGGGGPGGHRRRPGRRPRAAPGRRPGQAQPGQDPDR